MVLSLSLSVALLFLSLGLVARDLGRPTRLAPLRWVRVNGVEDGRRALVGGANVWLWGCAVASACECLDGTRAIRSGEMLMRGGQQFTWRRSSWRFATRGSRLGSLARASGVTWRCELSRFESQSVL